MADFDAKFLAHIEIEKTGQRWFITDGGVKIALKPISKVHIQRWQIEFDKTYPMPIPPVIEVEVGIGSKKEKMYQHFSDDPYYKTLLERRNSILGYEMQMFLIRLGTTTPAPDDYATMFPCADADERRADYISSLIITDDDVEYFIQAVISQTDITEQALSASATRFPSNGAGSERLQLPVLAEARQDN